jgi:hypothetical protein
LGMKEKKREKPRKDASEESDVSIVEATAQDLQEEVPPKEQEHVPEVVVEKRITEATEAIQEEKGTGTEIAVEQATEYEAVLPSWGSPEESEWMYGIPPRDEDRSLWAEEWSDYLLQWAEQNEVHQLSLAVFISEPPFKHLRNKVDSFKTIAQVLIDKEVAEWSDKKKRQLRIYWKPLEDWADIIYDWSLRTGKLRLDVKSIVIQESREAFARLPENDLYIVMALMVEKGYAEWIDKKKGAILVTA